MIKVNLTHEQAERLLADLEKHHQGISMCETVDLGSQPRPVKPMQTHGLYDEEWIPPKSPFIRYDKRDEAWGRYAGVGEIKKVLKPLYDVRDETNYLIGYCAHAPLDHFQLRIPVLPPRIDFVTGIADEACPLKIDEVELRVRIFSAHGEQFKCWFASSMDAPRLIECGFIKLLDRDRLDELVYEAKLRAYKKMHDRRMQSFVGGTFP